MQNLIVQYPNRTVDVDDILLNVLGIAIGTLCFYLVRTKVPGLYHSIDRKIVSAGDVT